jgi:hypothetical protein
MGDERVRRRRGVKDDQGRTLVVRWDEHEALGGWCWIPMAKLLTGGTVSMENLVAVGDLVRYRRQGDRKTYVGQIYRFGVHQNGYHEPAVDVADAGTGEILTIDIEDLRPLPHNWEGDPSSRLKLPKRVAKAIEEFEERYEREHEGDECADPRRFVAELRKALEPLM